MTFQDSIKTCLTQKYVDFNGRATRSEYWWFVLALFIVSILLYKFPIISLLFSVATLLPSLGAAVRRLHDTGRSGWWVLIALIPLIGAIILIVFMAQPGSGVENEYGAPPEITAT